MVHSAEDGSIPVGDLSALIIRLEAAEAGSRELDREIGEVTRSPMGNAGDVVGLGYAHFTTSIDAALALAERLMPGQEYEITTLYNVARVTLNMNHGNEGGPFYGCNVCCNVPLAICAAVLKSIPHGYEDAGVVSPNLKAKAQGDGG